MSIATKLLRLNEVKSEIRSAIEEKGQIVDNTDTFYSYGEKIRQIQSGGATADNNI